MIASSTVRFFRRKNVPLIKLIRVYNSESYDSYGDKLYDHLLDSISEWTEVSLEEYEILRDESFRARLGPKGSFLKIIMIEDLNREEVVTVIKDLKEAIAVQKKKDKADAIKRAKQKQERKQKVEANKLAKAKKLIAYNQKILDEANAN